jgi:hypothetical protein
MAAVLNESASYLGDLDGFVLIVLTDYKEEFTIYSPGDIARPRLSTRYSSYNLEYNNLYL